MLNSHNPLSQINANVIIWERNGVIRVVVLILVAIIVGAVIVLVRH
jgi:hypothetical protein